MIKIIKKSDTQPTVWLGGKCNVCNCFWVADYTEFNDLHTVSSYGQQFYQGTMPCPNCGKVTDMEQTDSPEQAAE